MKSIFTKIEFHYSFLILAFGLVITGHFSNLFVFTFLIIVHEIGHVICNHLTISAYEKLSENSLLQITDPTYEAEADYFAATILSPFPLYKELDIHSAIDVQRVFGLSGEASLYRYKQYLKWRSNRIKTAWENDMIRNYRIKC